MHKLFVVGFVIILTGLGLLVVSSAGQGGSSAGGAVFIGPIPIVFGTGPSGATLALLSVIIGIVMVVLLFIWSRRALGN